MPYIGRDLNRGNYLKLDDISSSFNGSTQTFNLTVGGSAFTPGSAFAILVSVGGVIQEPESAYQVENSEITFANAPTAQDSFFCIALGVALGIGVPGNGTVNGAQMSKPFNYDGFFYLDDANNRVGIGSAIPSQLLDVAGTIKALNYSGPISNASGISTFYDLRVTNNLTVEGSTSTLDTDLIGVDRVEVGANSNSIVGVAVTQSGTADILRLYDGSTQVVTVDDVGNVGIASAIPSKKLDVVGDTLIQGQLTVARSTHPQLIIKDSDTNSPGDENGISFRSANNTQYGFIGQTSTGGHTMLITTTNTVNPIRLQVNSSTNLEIGYTGVYVDNVNFFVNGGYNAYLSGEVHIADSLIHQGDTNTKIRFPAADTISFETSGYERFRITSGGIFGFNTTNPDTNFRFDFAGSARFGTGSYGSRIQFSRSGLGDELVIGVDGYGNSTTNEATIQSSINFGRPLVFATSNQERLRIKANGNVGIKIDDPQEPLNVKGTISTGRNVARELGTIIDISSDYNASRGAANVINGSKSYEDYANNDWITANGSRTNANLTIDLGEQINCDRFVIYNQNEYSNNVREVKRFTLEGSNDKSSWTTLLDDECGASYAHEPNPGFSFRIPSDFTDDTEGALYRYWRFTMKSFHGSTTLGGVMELELYEHAVGEHSDDEVQSELTSHLVNATDICAQNIYHDLPAFYVARSSAQGSFSDQTWTKIQFADNNSGAFDTNGYWDNTNARYTPTIPGYYQFQMNQSISHGSVQASYIAIYKNGSAYCQTGRYFFNGDNYDDAVMNTSCLMHCNGNGDYVEFYAWKYGGSSSFGGSSALSQASGFLVRHAGYRRHGDGVT